MLSTQLGSPLIAIGDDKLFILIGPTLRIKGASRQVAPYAHDRAASAHAGHKRVRLKGIELQLPPDFRPGGLLVRRDVRAVGKLSRQKHARVALRQFLRHADAAEESALPAES